MIKLLNISITYCLLFSLQILLSKEPIIIDHNCITLESVPNEFITGAKQNLKIAYGHTSHGSQISSGMSFLASQSGSRYQYNSGSGSLSYKESLLSGDLGNPDRTTWAKSTRNLLNSKSNDRNMIIWSWCGQVSSATAADISTYLTLMNQLELDYPNVIFVYMTGHLDGTGVPGNLNQRNEQIRDFCRTNNKILFDFADIESYDPDGKYFLDKKANDNCDYFDGTTQKNWAEEWCSANPGKCGDCGCAHSQCLNCMMKGNAFWWMLARIAGWDGNTISNIDVTDSERKIIFPNPATDYISVNSNLHLSDDFGYELYDISGAVIYEDLNLKTENQILTFDLSLLKKGVYHLRIFNQIEYEVFTFIKN